MGEENPIEPGAPAREPPVQDAPGSRRVPVRRFLWLNLLVPVAIIAAVVLWVDVGAVLTAFISLPAGVLVLALLLATLDRIAMALKWWQLVRAGGGILGALDAVRIQYQAAAAGRALPSALGADVIRAYLAARRRLPHGIVLASIAVEKLIAMLSSVIFAAAALLYFAGRLPPGVSGRTISLLLLGVLAVTATGLALLLLAPAHRAGARIVRALPARGFVTARVQTLLRKVSAALLIYRSRPVGLVVNLLLAMGEHLLQFAKLLVIARGLGIAVPLIPFFAIMAVALFVRRVAGYFDSWGLGEGAAVLTFALLGIAPEQAVALFLANFAVTTVALIPGAVFFVSHPVRFGAAPSATEMESASASKTPGRDRDARRARRDG